MTNIDADLAPWATSVDVEPLTIRTGAVVRDVDLGEDLSDGVIGAIRAALLRHRVVFFRGQRLSPEQHLRFASRFGEVTAAHPTLSAEAGQPQVLELDSLTGGRADGWHTDNTFTDRPPTFSILRSVIIPPCGGDTIWANTVAAYEHLPEPLRVLADGLRCVHTNAADAAASLEFTDEAARLHEDEFTSTIFETEHPVVRIHPETGERALLLGGFAQRVLSLSAGVPGGDRHAPAPGPHPREHRTLALERRRRGDVGQPLDPALRRQRLRRHSPRREAGHCGGGRTRWHRWPPQHSLRGDARAFSAVGAF